MNILEKSLPPMARDRVRTLIAAALGLFLGLRYNDFIGKLINSILPVADGLLMEALILIGVTIVIIWLSILLEKALDGR